jgi:hypothetical protein
MVALGEFHVEWSAVPRVLEMRKGILGFDDDKERFVCQHCDKSTKRGTAAVSYYHCLTVR